MLLCCLCYAQEIPVGRPKPERLTRKEAAKAAAAAAAADPEVAGPAGEGAAAAAGSAAAAADEPEQVIAAGADCHTWSHAGCLVKAVGYPVQ